MNKAFKLGKYHIAFNVFPKTAKNVAKVYLTGIRNWIADDSFNYTIVFGTFRIIFSIERKLYNCCG